MPRAPTGGAVCKGKVCKGNFVCATSTAQSKWWCNVVGAGVKMCVHIHMYIYKYIMHIICICVYIYI